MPLSPRWSPRRMIRTTRRTLRRWRRHWTAKRPSGDEPSTRHVFNPIDRLTPDHLVLKDGEGLRVLYRVFGIDLARMDADDQARWTDTFESFANACRGWRAQWVGRVRRNRLEVHLAATETLIGESQLTPAEVALAHARVRWQREFAEQHFLAAPEIYFVLPAPGDDEPALEERIDEAEGWFERLHLPYRRLDLFEETAVLAESYNVPAPDKETVAGFITDRLDVRALVDDGPPRYRAIVRQVELPPTPALPREPRLRERLPTLAVAPDPEGVPR